MTMGAQNGGASASNATVAQRLEASMFSIHSQILTGKINLPLDLNTFWAFLHQVDPMLASLGLGVPEVLNLWEIWQQRGLISIAYNNTVQPVEPFIVGAVPLQQEGVEVGKTSEKHQGEGDWPSLGNKPREELRRGVESVPNGKPNWGPVGGEAGGGHIPIARFPSVGEHPVDAHRDRLPGADAVGPVGAGVWGAFDGINLAPGTFN